MRNKVVSVLSLVAILMLGWPTLVGAAEYTEGENYIRLDNPLPTRNKAKIEVTEFFWYGCIHCYHFEPMLTAWMSKQNDDVYLQGSPALWNETMKLHAQAYYTAQVLGVLDKVHGPLFAALNSSPKARLDSEKALQKFFAEYGVAADDFGKAFNSFGVNSQVKQADARARGAQIEGTPEMLVNGKYRVSAKLAGGYPEMLEVVDQLIAQERSTLAQ